MPVGYDPDLAALLRQHRDCFRDIWNVIWHYTSHPPPNVHGRPYVTYAPNGLAYCDTYPREAREGQIQSILRDRRTIMDFHTKPGSNDAAVSELLIRYPTLLNPPIPASTVSSHVLAIPGLPTITPVTPPPPLPPPAPAPPPTPPLAVEAVSFLSAHNAWLQQLRTGYRWLQTWSHPVLPPPPVCDHAEQATHITHAMLYCPPPMAVQVYVQPVPQSFTYVEVYQQQHNHIAHMQEALSVALSAPRTLSPPPLPEYCTASVLPDALEHSIDAFDISSSLNLQNWASTGEVFHIHLATSATPSILGPSTGPPQVSSFLPDGVIITPASERYEQCPQLLMLFGKHPGATLAQRAALKALCTELIQAFAYSVLELKDSCYHGISPISPLQFALTSNKTVWTKPRRMSPLEIAITDKKCGEMLAAGVIEPAPTSVYASAPTIPAKKAPDGTWSDHRFCCDFRRCNELIAPMNTHVPVADDLFQKLGKSRYFTKLDMRSGFFQLPLHMDSRDITAFWWHDNLYRYTRAPFGIRTCPAAFQAIMDAELQHAGLTGCTECFIDDILVHSETFEEHLSHVRRVLQMLINCGLKAHPEKSLLCSDTVDFLGFDVSEYGLTPQEAKVKALLDMPHPGNLDELRSVLGQLRYYACFCPDFSAMARPMLDLLKKGTVWQWNADGLEGNAFNAIRNTIAQPGKALQRFHNDRPTFVHSDFSNVGLGGVLGQQDDHGDEYMAACISRSLNSAERRYSSYKGECLAAVWACKMFRPFIHGLHFTLVTDHEPLKWMMMSSTLEGAHARWALILQEFDFVIVHRPGTSHGNVDALSRLPLPSCKDVSGARLDNEHVVATARLLDATCQQADFFPPHDLITTATADMHGVYCTLALNTHPHPYGVFYAQQYGITLYEPFGGLCAGLEAVLRNNIPVLRYIYSDIELSAQRVATHRMTDLLNRYPNLLHPLATQCALTTLPMDVATVDTAALLRAGATDGTQWMVIAGPECKDFSPAGGSRGLAGRHSRTLYYCVQIIGALQQVQQFPPLYIVENAAMQYNWQSAQVRDHDFPEICNTLGTPVTFDAAQMGAYAHRLRNYWQNMVPPAVVSNAIAGIQRAAELQVDDILNLGRHSNMVQRKDWHPMYPANHPGQPRSALPTLVAYPESRAFRVYRDNTGTITSVSPGCVYDSNLGEWTEPNPEERERALGYDTGATAAPGVTLRQRHVITGNCMDQAAISGLLKTCVMLTGGPTSHNALSVHHTTTRCTLPPPPSPSLDPTLIGSDVAFYLAHTVMATVGGTVQDRLDPAQPDTGPHHEFIGNKKLTQHAREPGATDIHSDTAVLHMLRTGRLHTSVMTPIQVRRVNRRCRGYRTAAAPGGTEHILRVMNNGTTRVVPLPSERKDAISHAHVLSGHFGIRRTMHLLLQTYWWSGIMKDVAIEVSMCEVCNRTKAAFNSMQPTLHPLPICGMFYRWHVDLCGPFPRTTRGHVYVMIGLESYTKATISEALPNKEAFSTTYAFEHGVLSRYGACAEVVTDQGTEFQGPFDTMLARCFIDHRTTSPNHPQANGAAERCVQVFKNSLRCHCEDANSSKDWDTHLPYICMGYNSSKQMSTNCSPFQLLYARDPTFSNNVRQQFEVPLDFDHALSADAAAADIRRRAAYLHANMPIIANNLAIAQHRDRLRYAMTRSGTYLPKLRKFAPGDYVYLRRARDVSTIQVAAREVILRVVEVRDNGVILVMGKCGSTQTAHHSDLAPCHLPHINGDINPELIAPDADTACEICQFPNDEDLMLICDGCGTGWHTFCITPPLSEVPDGKWVCPRCESNGLTASQLEQRPSTVPQRHRRERSDTIFPDRLMRSRDKAAARYHNYQIARVTGKLRSSAKVEWGTLQFNGAEARPQYFTARYPSGFEEQLSTTALLKRRHLPPGSPTPAN